ncbi:MAG: hypothetical protein ACOVQN_12120 [Exiguobacterium sp.]
MKATFVIVLLSLVIVAYAQDTRLYEYEDANNMFAYLIPTDQYEKFDEVIDEALWDSIKYPRTFTSTTYSCSMEEPVHVRSVMSVDAYGRTYRLNDVYSAGDAQTRYVFKGTEEYDDSMQRASHSIMQALDKINGRLVKCYSYVWKLEVDTGHGKKTVMNVGYPIYVPDRTQPENNTVYISRGLNLNAMSFYGYDGPTVSTAYLTIRTNIKWIDETFRDLHYRMNECATFSRLELSYHPSDAHITDRDEIALNICRALHHHEPPLMSNLEKLENIFFGFLHLGLIFIGFGAIAALLMFAFKFAKKQINKKQK